MKDLQASGELPAQEKRFSIYGKPAVGTFKFCVIHKSVSTKTELSAIDELLLNIKYAIRHVAGLKVKWYGLDTSNIIPEHVPLITVSRAPARRIERVSGKP